MIEEVVRENSIGEDRLSVGFVLEVTSINADLESSMGHDPLTDFINSAFRHSGYPAIWKSPGDLDKFFDDRDYSSDLLVDPTSIPSYLSALTGNVNGDLISFSFYPDPTPIDFNAAPWEMIRKKLITSLTHDFLLPEHRFNFESSSQSFYLEALVVEGSNRLTVERLDSAIAGLKKITKVSKSAENFMELFHPEISSVRLLPSFVSGHIWAQLLSGCDWRLASQILREEVPIDIDAESFSWQIPEKTKNLNSYTGGWAVEWFRGVRRSLNFTPWPWQTESIDEYFDSDEGAYYRGQVDRLLSGRQPEPQEKVAAFAMLYWLIDHEDSEEDDAPYTSDKVRELIENFLSDSLGRFIEDNLALIKQCFTALNLTAEEDGSDHYDSSLPEWAGSEGVLAGVKAPYGSSESTGHLLDFEPSLFESVEKVWPEFISIASQPLP